MLIMPFMSMTVRIGVTMFVPVLVVLMQVAFAWRRRCVRMIMLVHLRLFYVSLFLYVIRDQCGESVNGQLVGIWALAMLSLQQILPL